MTQVAPYFISFLKYALKTGIAVYVITIISLAVIITYIVVISFFFIHGPIETEIAGFTVRLISIRKPVMIMLAAVILYISANRRAYLAVRHFLANINFLGAVSITIIAYMLNTSFFVQEHGGKIGSIVWLSEKYCKRGCIPPENVPTVKGNGYDGQFYFRFAMDPFYLNPDIGPSLDAPAYRHQRILYPLLLHLVTGGIPKMIPYAMALLNLLALSGLAVLGVSIASRSGIPSFWGLCLPAYAGFIYSVVHALPEPIAIFFMIGGLLMLREEGKQSYAAFLLSLAVLTRETTLVSAIGICAYNLYETAGRIRNKKFLISPPLPWIAGIAPIVTYALLNLYLLIKWGTLPFAAGKVNLTYPFVGLLTDIYVYISSGFSGNIQRGPFTINYEKFDLIYLVGYLILTISAVSILRKKNDRKHETFVFFVALGMASILGECVFNYRVNFTRALAELYSISMLLVLRDARRIAAPATWLIIFVYVFF